ncbi:MAG: HYR domain-containing protein [Saprospiraceae bacterium]|nr:HYR domain-containing protein [Candidatus Vicinibacter affinis]
MRQQACNKLISSSGSLFTNAETNLTFMATDQAGNTNTCSFTIRVQNQSDFEIQCPADDD